MPQAIPVFILSLPEATARRERVARHHQRLGIAFTVLDGVDGRTMGEAARAAAVAPGRALTPSEIGCHLSHAKAWEALVASGADCAVVLEDDGLIDRRFAPLLRQRLPTDRFDYLFLDVDAHNERGLVAYDRNDGLDLGHGFRAFTLSDGGEGAHAYVITRTEAQRRLAEAVPLLGPADIYHVLPYRPRMRALVAPKGAWVAPTSLVSSINDRTEDEARVPLRALRRSALFYDLLDWLRGDRRGKQRRIDAMVRDGTLPAGHDWRAMPAGRRMLFD
ncbi:MAG: glycosyltransferase family 25 protein [Sphingomonadales bacterium]|nr:glycosyltransferase family 25 protein [Sphingomonadales bacterium]